MLPGMKSGRRKKRMVETTTMGKEIDMRASGEAKMTQGLSFEMPQMSFYEAIQVFKAMGIDQILMTSAEDGIRMAAIDASRVGLIVEYIDSKRCVKYTRGNAAFGVDLNDLKGVLTYIKGTIKFSQSEDTITMTGADGFTKTFSVLDDRITVPIPNLDYRTGGVVNGKQFYTALSVAADMADYVSLTADGSNVIVSATRETGKGKKNEMEMPIKILKGSFKGEEGIKATYNSSMLKDLIRPLKGGDIMVRFVLTLTNNAVTTKGTEEKTTKSEKKGAGPLKINFKIGQNGADDVRGYALLAPVTV